jgi:Flp pilus assembly protein TadD
VYAAQCERGMKSFRKASEDLGQAVADFTQAIELEPVLASAYAGRAIAYLLLQQDVAAKADADQAVALGFDPGALQQAGTHWS